MSQPASPKCKHGHPYPDNLAYRPNGWAYCRACARIRSRNWWTANRAGAGPDDAAIARAVAGDPPARLTPRERHAAIAQLEAQHLSAAAIAARVGCTPRTIHRARAKGATR